MDPALAAAHQGAQFVVDQLDHLLRGGQALQDVGADGLVGDGLDKILDHLEVDVGLQQRQAHLAHGLPDVAFGQASLGAQLFENVIEFVA